MYPTPGMWVLPPKPASHAWGGRDIEWEGAGMKKMIRCFRGAGTAGSVYRQEGYSV